MTSAQDEVSIVVKCVRLGAATYLVKPLRMNELVKFMDSYVEEKMNGIVVLYLVLLFFEITPLRSLVKF